MAKEQEIESELKYTIVSKVGFQNDSKKKVTGDEVMLKPSTAEKMVKENPKLSLQLVESKPEAPKEPKPVKDKP